MKVLIKFNRYIIENGKRDLEISFVANGIFQDNIIKYIDNDKGMNLISIKENQIYVERKSEIQSIMTFKKGVKTKYSMIASFGQLELDIYTNQLNVEKDKIFIVYNVIEELNSYKTYELNITFTPLK